MPVQSFESYVSEVVESGFEHDATCLKVPRAIRRVAPDFASMGERAPATEEPGRSATHFKTAVRFLPTGLEEMSADRGGRKPTSREWIAARGHAPSVP